MSSLLAIIFGIAFGFILQRVGAFEYKNILNTLRLKDMMIAKFMFLSVGVTAIGVFSLRALGFISLDMISFNVVGTLLGGLIFGVGFAVTGYCPGTSIGAWAEGKKDAAYVVLGGMLGVLVFALIQGDVSGFLAKYEMGEVMLGDFISMNTLGLAAIYSLAIGVIVFAVDVIEMRIRDKGMSKELKPTLNTDSLSGK